MRYYSQINSEKMFPYQPLEFLGWLRSYMAERNVPCLGIIPRLNGVLAFVLKTDKGKGVYLSHPDQEDDSWKGIGKSTALLLKSALCSLIDKDCPPLFTVNASKDDVIPFTPEVIREYLVSKIEIDRTEWGPFLFSSISGLGNDCIEFRFKSSYGDVSMNFLPVKAEKDENGMNICRLSNMGLKVTEDCRSPGQRRLLPFQVENWVGYAIGRSFRHNQKFLLGKTSPLRPEIDNKERRDSIDVYRVTRLESYIKQWKGEDRWRRFFYPETPYIEDMVRWDENDVYISHESLECSFNMSPGLLPEQRLFLFDRKVPFFHVGEGFGVLFTDLRDADVVGSGTINKLEGALESAAGNPNTKSIVVITGCLADMIGDSPLPFIKRQAREDAPDIHWFGKVRHGPRTMRQILQERLGKTRRAVKKFDPKGVSLVCPGNAREQSEIEQWISLLDGRVLGTLIPSIGFSAYERIKRATKIVPVYQSVASLFIGDWLEEPNLSILDPPTPFGLDGIKEWLKIVTKGLNAENKSNDIFHKLIDPLHEELNGLKNQAKNYAVGFIVDKRDLFYLNRADIFFGFKIFELLLEMGFYINIMAYGEEEEIRSILNEGPLSVKEGERMDIRFFHDPKSLRKVLSTSPCAIVFSNIAADPRAIEAGKGVFSEVFFEVGIHGLIRTYQRLLKAKEWIPFRNYTQYIK